MRAHIVAGAALLLCAMAGAVWFFKAPSEIKPVRKALKSQFLVGNVTRRLDGDMYFKWEIKVQNGRASSGNLEVDYGCGGDDQKCHCNNPHGDFLMEGRGTSGSATGLVFQCTNVEFTFENAGDPDYKKVRCDFHVDLPYVKVFESNSLKVSCTPDWLAVQTHGEGEIFYDENSGKPFPNLNGDGEWTSFPFVRNQDYVDMGTTVIELKPKYRMVPLPKYTDSTGSWVLVASGGTHTIEESVQSSRTLSRADAESVAHSVSVSMQFEMGGHEGGPKVSVGSENSNSWAETITNTFSHTEGTSTRKACTSVTCAGGIFQWTIESTSDDAKAGPPVTTRTCHFVCQESPAASHKPPCTLGWCNRNYFGDQHQLHSRSKAFQCPCCRAGYEKPSFECSYGPKGSPRLTGPYIKEPFVVNPDIFKP